MRLMDIAHQRLHNQHIKDQRFKIPGMWWNGWVLSKPRIMRRQHGRSVCAYQQEQDGTLVELDLNNPASGSQGLIS